MTLKNRSTRVVQFANGALRVNVLLTAIILAGCQTQSSKTDSAKPNLPNELYVVTATDAAAIELAVRAELRDPTSAVFGSGSAVRDASGVVYVCGIVNGRNGYGGYTGFVPYMGILATNPGNARVFAVTGIGDAPGTAKSVATAMLCNKYGVVNVRPA